MNNFSLLLFAFSFLSFGTLFTEGYLGINWGRMATQRMLPSMVVDLLLQNNIKEVKIFSASDNVLEAFGGTDIRLAITLPNEDTKTIIKSQGFDKWVYENVAKFNNSVNFRYVCIGTQPLSARLFNRTYPTSVRAIDMMQKALDKEFSHIKATMSHLTDILIPVKKPSEGDFKAEIKPLIAQSCQALQRNQAPIGLDIFPLLSVNDVFNNDTEFAFFENNSTSVFKDGDKTYSNVFEVIYDTYDVALGKVGCPNMTIIVDEIGWPTDGIRDGNIPNAQRFHQGLAKFVASNRGTPRRPGPIDMYIHNLADENAINKWAGSYMRHWGIYKFDGQPKFNIDFEGHGRDKILPSAIGITHMPKRWCIYNNKTVLTNGSLPVDELLKLYDYACNIADCTAADPGGSCSNLSFSHKISYGFNMGFQGMMQKVMNHSCDYEGYGVIVSEDPSTPTCRFPVEILAAEVPNFTGILPIDLAHALKPSSGLVTIIVQMLFIFFTLMCTW